MKMGCGENIEDRPKKIQKKSKIIIKNLLVVIFKIIVGGRSRFHYIYSTCTVLQLIKLIFFVDSFRSEET